MQPRHLIIEKPIDNNAEWAGDREEDLQQRSGVYKKNHIWETKNIPHVHL